MKTRSPPERSESNPFRSSKPPSLVKTGNKATNGKKVNVGSDGETPKKYIHIEPSKVYDYNEVDAIEEASDEDQEENSEDESADHDFESHIASVTNSAEKAPQRSSPGRFDASDIIHGTGPFEGTNGRPKTSRGKSHPSPDEFYNYVVPSPENARKAGKSRLVLDGTSAVENQNGSGEAENGHSHVHFPTDTNSNSNGNSPNDTEAPPKPLNGDSQNGHSSHISDQYLLGIHLKGVSREKQVALLGCWLFGSALRV